MAELYKHRYWCNTESCWVYKWEESSIPSYECPNNNEHEIKDSSESIVDKVLEIQPHTIEGRTLVQSSSRPWDTDTCFAGAGDDPTNGNGDVFGTDPSDGEWLVIHHEVGDDLVQSKYFDINSAENASYIHEGYLEAMNGLGDRLDFNVVPRLTVTTPGEDTNYTAYPLDTSVIMPAAGNGDLVIASEDICLVEMTADMDTGVRMPGFWNADYNTTTHEFENITPVPTGTGIYNMFKTEKILRRVAYGIPIIGSPFIKLQASDTTPVGHGMRLKLVAMTYGTDHEWWAASFLTMHRKKSC